MAIIDGLNKAFENKNRLGILSVLTAKGSADLPTLKSLLELTDGNLASHTRHLEDAGNIRCEKSFIGRKPNTMYVITESGRKAFAAHVDALERFLKECRG